jgi:hypothetical protein
MRYMRDYHGAFSDASRCLPCEICGGLFQEDEMISIIDGMEFHASHLPWILDQRYVSVYTISEPVVLDFCDPYSSENVDLAL